MQLSAAFMMCFVPVAACQSPELSPAESPSEPPTPPVTFGAVGDHPVIEPAEFDAAYLLPGAAVVDDGTYHLYPVAFDVDPTEQPRVLHLTSDDGTSWTGDPEGSVLADFRIDLAEPGAIPSSAFVDADGTWVMYGGGRLPTGDRSIVWRATAPGPNGPWTAHPEPILEPGDDGWDSGITDHPAVQPTESGYLMAYGGASRSRPNRNRIGFATSPDGIAWTRVDATLEGADDDQALGPNACGVEARTMFEPHLLPTDTGHSLVFGVMVDGPTDAMQIVGATSQDGTTWSCMAEQPLITSEAFPLTPDLHSFVAVDDEDGTTMMFVEVLGDDRSELWLVRPASE